MKGIRTNLFAISEDILQRKKTRSQIIRYAFIYEEKYGYEGLESIEKFLEEYFYICLGQVAVSSHLGKSQIETAILANFRLTSVELKSEIYNCGVSHDQKLDQMMRLDEPDSLDSPQMEQTVLQTIGLLTPFISYDFVFDSVEPRYLKDVTKDSQRFTLEMWGDNVFDCCYFSGEDMRNKPFHYRRACLERKGFKLHPEGKFVHDKSIAVIDSYSYQIGGQGGCYEILLGTNIRVKKKIYGNTVQYFVIGNLASGLEWYLVHEREIEQNDLEGYVLFDFITKEEQSSCSYCHTQTDWTNVISLMRAMVIKDFTNNKYLGLVEGYFVQVIFKGEVQGVGFRKQLYDMTENQRVSGVIENYKEIVKFNFFIALESYVHYLTMLYRFANLLLATMEIRDVVLNRRKVQKWFVRIKQNK